jgi:hypothetical protein
MTSFPQSKFFVVVPSVALPQTPTPTPFAKRSSVGVVAPQSQTGGAGASFRLSSSAVLEVVVPP